MSDFKNIVLEFNDGVATMTFNRPEVRNSLDTETLSEIHRALGMVEDNGEAGVLVLTGAGEAFCAGVNLKGYSLDDREKFRAGFREVAMWWHQMLHRIVHLPMPVLAAVNGVAVGGGLGLTLAADMAICNETARFYASWMSNGVANDGGSSIEKGALAEENGADFVVITKADDLEALKGSLKAQVKAQTGAPDGRGCDVVIDTVGGDLFEAGLRILRFAGRLVIVGFASGDIPSAKANYLLYNNLSVIGAPLDIRFEMAYATIERGVNTWLSLMASGKLRANVTEHHPLDDFVKAAERIVGRQVKGKVVLTL